MRPAPKNVHLHTVGLTRAHTSTNNGWCDAPPPRASDQQHCCLLPTASTSTHVTQHPQLT